jgi:class 3 adenylate cyclase
MAIYTLTDFPYAPGIANRSLDAQSDTRWMLAMVTHFLGIFLSGFLMSMLVVRARSVQDVRLNRAHSLIRRYIPSQLADKIIEGQYPENFKPERAKLTVFFSDIEGFTEASDHLDPEDLAALLNEYLAEMMAIAERYGATINQILGDGIMAFFGAPQATSDKDHALRAVRMALVMQKRMEELKDVWVERGIQKPFRIRIGINTGHASVGDYGSPGRKLYSAIGVQTNLAARIQASCNPGKVLISHSTWALVHSDFPCIDRGDVQLKGVHYPVHVYEVDRSA